MIQAGRGVAATRGSKRNGDVIILNIRQVPLHYNDDDDDRLGFTIHGLHRASVVRGGTRGG